MINRYFRLEVGTERQRLPDDQHSTGFLPLEAGCSQVTSKPACKHHGNYVHGVYLLGFRHKNMNGTLGLASWRWVFIFDFIIGIPIAVFGFFCCPGKDMPRTIGLLQFNANIGT